MSTLTESISAIPLEESLPWREGTGDLPRVVLVTGAAGFVGSRLSRSLLNQGVSVIGLDNFDPYYDRSHKERHLQDLRDHPAFRLIKADLRDADAIRAAVRSSEPEAVAHLAAMAAVRYSVRHPLVYGEVNVQGTVHLLDAVRDLTGCRTVLASTGSVYGQSTPVPFVEDAPADRPLAPYPASKRAMELMAHAYNHLWGIPVTILRFFNVYGPHGRPDMMPWQWAQRIAAGHPITLFDGGRMRRDWTYIDDIVAGFEGALRRPLGYAILNLGRGRPVENRDFVRILEDLLEKRAVIEDAPAPPSEPPVTYADISRARQTIGYRPEVDVEDGLARFVAWLHENDLLHGQDRSD